MTTRRNIQDVQDTEFEELVELWYEARAKEEELNRQYKERKEVIDRNKARIQQLLLAKMNELGVDGVRTKSGTVSKVEKVRPVVTDWPAFWDYVIETKNPGLLQKRVSATAVVAEMEELDAPLPGVRLDSEYTIRVRRK